MTAWPSRASQSADKPVLTVHQAWPQVYRGSLCHSPTEVQHFKLWVTPNTSWIETYLKLPGVCVRKSIPLPCTCVFWEYLVIWIKGPRTPTPPDYWACGTGPLGFAWRSLGDSARSGGEAHEAVSGELSRLEPQVGLFWGNGSSEGFTQTASVQGCHEPAAASQLPLPSDTYAI